MPLPITYAQVANRVNAWCNNNCINLGDRWTSACPAWCKSGYVSGNVLFAGANESLKGSIYRFNLTNGITQAAALNTNNTQSSNSGFGAFLVNRGAILANNVPKSEWLNIAYGLIEWCAVSVYFMGNFIVEKATTNPAVYSVDPTVYLVWKSVSRELTPDYSSTLDYKEVIADDVTLMMKKILDNLSRTDRCISAQYTITLASN